MNCKPCMKSFTGLKPYTQHIQSDKHKRKVISSSLMGLSDQIECILCNISFDSAQNYHIHSLTVDHVNNMSKDRNDALNNLIVNSVSSSAENNDTSSEDQTLIPNDETDSTLSAVRNSATSLFSECKICNKKFSGPVPYTAHITSAAHKKKAEVGNGVLDAEGATENASNTFSCKLCKKVFTGPYPHQQHLISAAHKKVEVKSNLGSEATENASEKYTCEPCKKEFTGQIPYDQHLISKVHKNKLKLIKICGPVKESNESDSDSACDSNESKKNPFFCMFCNIKCSGLIPYKQHLEGDNHAKNARVARPKHVKALKRKARYISVGQLNTSNEEDASALQTLNNEINDIENDQHIDGDSEPKEPRVALKGYKIPKLEAKDTSVGLLNTSNEEDAGVIETPDPVKNEKIEDIEMDVSQATESIVPAVDLVLTDFVSSEKINLDQCKSEIQESSEENASQETLKEASTEHSVKKEKKSSMRLRSK